MKIATVIITTDRSPRNNYLASTIHSFAASGLFDHKDFSLDIFHSGEGEANIPRALLERHNVTLHTESSKVRFNPAVVQGLSIGHSRNADWVLFCEDDIQACVGFPEFVLSQLQLAGDAPMVDFVTYYSEIVDAYFNGDRIAHLDAKGFYGTQCFALSSVAAKDFARFIVENMDSKEGFADTWFNDWLSSSNRTTQIASSVPSAAQHIGVDSNHQHKFINAPGFKDDLDKSIAAQTGEFELTQLKKNQVGLKRKDSLNAYELNLPAQLIYLSCDGSHTIKQIVDELVQNLNQDAAQLNSEVRQCIKELSDLGAVHYLR